jgi:hypothetical protein
VGKPEGKRPLGRNRCGWEDNIKKGLRLMGWGGMDWSRLVHDKDHWRALINKVINFRVL